MINFMQNNNLMTRHSLDVLKNENSKQEKLNARIYSDLSTSAYVKTFLDDDKNRYGFIDYTYNQINTDIQIKINKLLNDHGHPILNGIENIILIFKGGNVMYEVALPEFIALPVDNMLSDMRQYISSYRGKFNNKTKITTINEFLRFIKSKLQVSDVDYSIIIITDSYKRFQIIHKYVLEIVTKSLNKIAKTYDTLWHDQTRRNIDIDKQFQESKNRNVKLFKNVKDKLTIMKSYLKHNVILDPNFSEDFIEFVKNFNNTNNLLILLVFYQCLETYKLMTNTRNYDQTLTKYHNIIKSMIKYKKTKIINNNMYRNKSDELKKNIIASYNDNLKVGDKFYATKIDDKNLLVREIIKLPSDDDIEFKTRQDFTYYCIDDINKFYSLQKMGNEKNHYISFNNTIKITSLGGASSVDFDLIRIKFNVQIKNCINTIHPSGRVKNTLNIPSEFIDISIPMWNSDNLKNVRLEDHASYMTLNNNIKLYSYELTEIYEDLSYILTNQYYCPWMDSKYDKRIIRLITFAYLDLVNQDKLYQMENLANFCNIILDYLGNKDFEYPYEKISTYTIFSGDDIRKILNRFLENNINFDIILAKDDNKYFQALISSMIIFSFIHKFPGNVFIDYYNRLRRQYNFTEISNVNAMTYFIRENRANFLNMVEIVSDLCHTFLYYHYIKRNSQQGGNYYFKYLKYKKKLLQMYEPIRSDDAPIETSKVTITRIDNIKPPIFTDDDMNYGDLEDLDLDELDNY